MSRATKRKHVIREVLVEDILPPTKEQTIVQVIAGRGNNLHLVAPPAGEPFLSSMPTKFRRNVWIKRGDYLLVEPIAEGDKVKAEIVTIITRDHKKYYCELGIWPPEFDKPCEVSEIQKDAKEGSSSEGEDLFVNTNRQMGKASDYSDSDETSGNESGSEIEERTGDSSSDHIDTDDGAEKSDKEKKSTSAVVIDSHSKNQSDTQETDVLSSDGVC